MEFDHLIKENFQLYKGIGISFSLLLIVLFQLLCPNRLAFQEMLAN